MLRKLFLTAMILVGWSNSNVFGAAPSLTTTQDYELLPGKPLRVTNVSPKPLNAYCEAHLTTRDNHNVFMKMLTGNGEVNGNTLKRGQSLTMALYHNQIVAIMISANSDIEFTNLGPYLVKVMCNPY